MHCHSASLVLRVWWWLLVEGRSHITLCDNGITFKLAHDYICSVITNVVVTYLAVFKLNTIANSLGALAYLILEDIENISGIK